MADGSFLPAVWSGWLRTGRTHRGAMQTAIAIPMLVWVLGAVVPAVAAQNPSFANPGITPPPALAAHTQTATPPGVNQAGQTGQTTQTAAPGAGQTAGGATGQGQPGPAQPVSLVGRAAVQFDASRSTGEGTILIVSPISRRVILGAGPIIDTGTKEVVPGVIELQPIEVELATNVPQAINVKVSDLLIDGTGEFDLLAGNARVGAVSVTRGPFSVSVADGPVTFQHGETTALTLRNEARYQYAVRWMIHLGPFRYCGDGSPQCAEDASNWSVVTIPPKDSVTIHVEPPAEWFDRSVMERTGSATLSLAPGPGLPKRVQTLRATLVGPYVGWQWMFILFMLLLGATMSLLVRHWVPNTQRKRELKEQARRVRMKIDAFSDDIDYELRAQTRVQGHLLESLRRSAWTFLPHYESVAVQCAAGLAMLEKRVDLIEEIDSVFAVERVKWQSCPPPSQIDRVEETLRGALEALKKAQISEPEFLAVKAEVERARMLTSRMGAEGAEFGQELAARLKAVADELKAYSDTVAYKELQNELPGLFRSVAPASDGSTPPGEISPLRYSLVDYNLSALQICRDYIWLASGAAATDRLTTEIKTALVAHLARHSWGELRLARLLLKQFRENSYEDQIWQAIEAGDEGIYVVHEPNELRPLQLVQFRIYFRRSELNWAGAKDLVSPEWEFSDGSRPRGWSISQFFTDTTARWPGPMQWWRKYTSKEIAAHTATETVIVHFEARPGSDGMDRRKKDALKLTLPIHKARVDDPRSRTVTELLGLAVSIFIPLISLVATAQEQLAQNPAGGALTIFLLGFSSDALISVFKQRVTGTA